MEKKTILGPKHLCYPFFSVVALWQTISYIVGCTRTKVPCIYKNKAQWFISNYFRLNKSNFDKELFEGYYTGNNCTHVY